MNITKYEHIIYTRFNDLLISGKTINDMNNYDLATIFEYFSCIRLFELYHQPFFHYSDIDPIFKENNKLSQRDTGIDACNLVDTIVQCKLRSKSLTWTDCGTFFGS